MREAVRGEGRGGAFIVFLLGSVEIARPEVAVNTPEVVRPSCCPVVADLLMVDEPERLDRDFDSSSDLDLDCAFP